MFRFLQAGSEVSTLLGRMPSAVGYQPTLSTEMGSFQERIVATDAGSITSIQAIYVPADDLTDPAMYALYRWLNLYLWSFGCDNSSFKSFGIKRNLSSCGSILFHIQDVGPNLCSARAFLCSNRSNTNVTAI